MSGVPRPNYTQVPNLLLDEWLPKIDTLAEMKVALAIVRATAGWHRTSAVLSLSELQRATGLGRAAVVAGLKAAHERGYVDKVAVGQGFSYGLVVDGEVVRSANQPDPSDQFAERTSASTESEPLASSLSEPPYKERGKTPSGGKKESLPGLEIEGGRSCPSTVDRRKVTTDECEMAWAIMDAFNSAAGTKARAKGYVEKIIRRCRENPELELADHQRVIAATFSGHHWWSGRPDPAIIYGSDTQFDRCLGNAPTGGPSGASVQSGGVQTPAAGNDLDEVVRWD